MKRIKLSAYLKANKYYILRNAFIKYVKTGEYSTTEDIDYIRNALINDLECDNIDLLYQFKNYLTNNLLNYSEVKKAFQNDRNDTIPKPKLKDLVHEMVNNTYYEECVLGAK